MSAQLAGRVAAVTGGAQGIGRAIAEALAAAGARVAIGDRDGAAATATAEQLPGTAHGFTLDVTDTESFQKFLAATESLWGPVDVLVNNAGVMWVGGFDAEPEEMTARMLDVNLHGAIRGVRLAAPGMRARGRGHIITMASAAAQVSPPGEATYAATKHGILGYLAGVREELHGTGVQLSVLMPGVVETALSAGTDTGAAKVLQPADVARAVVRVIEKPRFEVTLPGYVGPLRRVVDLFPQRVRDLLIRRLVPNQVTATHGSSTRAGYESQILGKTTKPEVTDDND